MASRFWLSHFVALLLIASFAAGEEFYPRGSGVDELTATHFDAFVGRPRQVTFVEFFAPWCPHCKALKAEYIKAAKQLSGAVRFVAVDCEDAANRQLCNKEGVSAFPTLRIYKGRNEYTDYTGERKAAAIAEAAKAALPSNKVTILTPKTEATFFGTANSKLPKAVLFSKQETGSPLIKALSWRFAGRMAFAEAVKGKNRKLEDRLGVTEFPSLVVVPAGASPKDGGIKYEGPLKARPLARFLRAHALPTEPGSEAAAADAEIEGLDVIPELVDETCMQALCVNSGKLCAVLAVVRGEEGDKQAEARLQAAIATFEGVMESRDDASLFQFVWLDSAKQGEFLDKALGIFPADYPQVFVLSARKEAFAPFIGSYGVDSVSRFLSDVLKGKVKTGPILTKALPPLSGESRHCAALLEKQQKASTTSGPSQKQQGKKGSSSSGGGGSTPAAGLIPRGKPGLIWLTPAEFRTLVLSGRHHWLVALTRKQQQEGAAACETCAKLTAEMEQAAKQLKHMALVASIDIDSLTEEERKEIYVAFKVDGSVSLPIMKAFGPGYLNEPKEVEGAAEKDAKALYQYGLSLLSDEHVTVVNTQTVAAFLTRDPELSHVVFVSDKQTVPPLVKALATFFAGEAAFAVSLGKDEEFAKQFRSKFPGVTFFQGPLRVHEGGLQAFSYPGPLTFEHLAMAINQMVQKQRELAEKGESVAAQEAGLLHVPRKATEFERLCLEAPGLCVIALFGEGAPSQAPVQLHEIALALKNKPLTWVLANRRSQYDLVDQFNLPREGAVDIVVFAPRKKRYAALTSYSAVTVEKGRATGINRSAVQSFLESVLSGKTKTSPVDAMPQWVDEPDLPQEVEAAQQQQQQRMKNEL